MTQQQMPKSQMSQGYTPKEAALVLGNGMTGKKVRRLVRKGTVKAVKHTGRWYITRKVLTALVKVQAAAELAA